jgi:hypothetical protein
LGDLPMADFIADLAIYIADLAICDSGRRQAAARSGCKSAMGDGEIGKRKIANRPCRR